MRFMVACASLIVCLTACADEEPIRTYVLTDNDVRAATAEMPVVDSSTQLRYLSRIKDCACAAFGSMPAGAYSGRGYPVSPVVPGYLFVRPTRLPCQEVPDVPWQPGESWAAVSTFGSDHCFVIKDDLTRLMKVDLRLDDSRLSRQLLQCLETARRFGYSDSPNMIVHTGNRRAYTVCVLQSAADIATLLLDWSSYSDIVPGCSCYSHSTDSEIVSQMLRDTSIAPPVLERFKSGARLSLSVITISHIGDEGIWLAECEIMVMEGQPVSISSRGVRAWSFGEVREWYDSLVVLPRLKKMGVTHWPLYGPWGEELPRGGQPIK